jgi:hypothetical protein
MQNLPMTHPNMAMSHQWGLHPPLLITALYGTLHRIADVGVQLSYLTVKAYYIISLLYLDSSLLLTINLKPLTINLKPLTLLPKKGTGHADCFDSQSLGENSPLPSLHFISNATIRLYGMYTVSFN